MIPILSGAGGCITTESSVDRLVFACCALCAVRVQCRNSLLGYCCLPAEAVSSPITIFFSWPLSFQAFVQCNVCCSVHCRLLVTLAMPGGCVRLALDLSKWRPNAADWEMFLGELSADDRLRLGISGRVDRGKRALFRAIVVSGRCL